MLIHFISNSIFIQNYKDKKMTLINITICNKSKLFLFKFKILLYKVLF